MIPAKELKKLIGSGIAFLHCNKLPESVLRELLIHGYSYREEVTEEEKQMTIISWDYPKENIVSGGNPEKVESIKQTLLLYKKTSEKKITTKLLRVMSIR